MSIHGDIRARLIGNAAVTAIVGPRVYYRELPSTAVVPAVTFHQVSRMVRGEHSGESMGPRRWQFNCWAAVENGSDYLPGTDTALAEAVEAALKGWRSAMPLGQVDLRDQATMRPYVALDMSIWATDPVPA